MAARPAALVAEKFRLAAQIFRQGCQRVKGAVQAEIRHDKAELRPLQFLLERRKISQYLRRGGDKVQLRIVFPQIVGQQVRVHDDAILRGGALAEQAAERVAARVGEVFRPQQRIAEGQPRRDAVLPQQGGHLARAGVPAADAAAAPDAVRRCTIDRSNVAPLIEIFRIGSVQRQKRRVQLVKFKQAGQVIVGDLGLVHRGLPIQNSFSFIIAGRISRCKPHRPQKSREKSDFFAKRACVFRNIML